MKIIIGTYRYYYNRCVSYLNNYDNKTKKIWFLVDPIDLKTKVTIKVTDLPYNFRNMREYLKT